MVSEEINGIRQAAHGPMNATSDSETESLPQPSQKDQQGALVVQDQEGGEQAEEDFIPQVLQCARKEWKSFRLQHSDVNEETFVEAERFCIKQWLIQQGITLANLPAFEQAEEQFARKLEQHAGEIEASAQKMEDPIFTEAQFLGVSIAKQAHERSKQAREAIQLSGNIYLANKISTLRAREREQAAQQRQEDVRQGTKDLKASGITIVYENQKEALEEREQALREHMSTLAHLIEESLHRIDATRYIAIFEKYLKNIDILLKDLRLKTVDTYRVRGAVGIVASDWDAARQRAMHVRAQVKTLQEVITAIQAGTEDALTRAKAEKEHIQKVKQTLERVRKRRAEIETWAEAEHEGCEAQTRIHLQAPNGAEGRVAMLSLPNNTQIKLADIDLGQTRHDPARPEDGVTITLKQDGCQINLLAAACVMRGSLTQELLREAIDKSINKNINRIRYILDTN